MNDPNVRLTLTSEARDGDAVVGYASPGDGLVHVRQEGGFPRSGRVDVVHGAMHIIVETAEYISDRTTHLSANVSEGTRAVETLGAVSRQIRTLSSNTSLEAARLGNNATVAEIARQMRLLSQQVTALSEHLTACLRAQGIALGEMNAAIDAILADATSTQAALERGLGVAHDRPAPLLGLLQSVPESAAALEVPADA